MDGCQAVRVSGKYFPDSVSSTTHHLLLNRCRRLSPSEMPKPVREILNLASTGLRNLRGITANLKEIIERSEITSNFIERATIEYREGPVGGFERPLGAAGRQMERCVVLSEEMATTYNSFGACLERTMKVCEPLTSQPWHPFH